MFSQCNFFSVFSSVTMLVDMLIARVFCFKCWQKGKQEVEKLFLFLFLFDSFALSFLRYFMFNCHSVSAKMQQFQEQIPNLRHKLATTKILKKKNLIISFFVASSQRYSFFSFFLILHWATAHTWVSCSCCILTEITQH